MLKNNASQKLATLKPLTKCSAIKIIKALMKNKNNPSEKIVTGSVRIIKRGLMVASKIAKITATTMAVKISLNDIPGNKQASIKALTEVINILSKNFIFAF